MAARFLVKKFDEDLVERVKAGTKNIALICSQMGVEEKDARKRVAQLVKKKLLFYDASLDQAGLSVDGYSFFEEKKRRHEKQSARLPSPRSLIQPVQTSFVAPKLAQIIDAEKQNHSQIDLHELMRIGAPNGEQRKKQKQFPKLDSTQLVVVQEKKHAPSALRNKLNPVRPAKTSAIVQIPFSLSVGRTRPFGHCFAERRTIGIALRSISDNNSSCIRCGRKLELSVDKKTVEIVKGIKDAFED